MDKRMKDLYDFPGFERVRDVELQELAIQCAELEEQILRNMEEIPEEERYLLESYMEVRDEMEFLHVKAALRIGKRLQRAQ